MEPHATSPDITRPHEAGEVELNAEDAITVDEALLLARREYDLAVPKSTLQRWLKQNRVKSVLHVHRYGRKYLIDREDWLAKAFDIANEESEPRQAPEDLMRPDDTSPDITRPHEASRDGEDKLKQLEHENLQLTIDKAARDQIIMQLRDERTGFIEGLKDQAHQIGQLETRLQLSAPAATPTSVPERDGDRPAEASTPETVPEAVAKSTEAERHAGQGMI